MQHNVKSAMHFLKHIQYVPLIVTKLNRCHLEAKI